MTPQEGPDTPACARVVQSRRGAWAIQRRHGPVSDLLAWEGPPPATPRLARLYSVERPALVLGSAQRPDVADRVRAAAAGVDVVRRRSGGGAVLVGPQRQVWADLFVTEGDRLWSDDVSRAVAWVGELWSRVVAPFVATPPAAFTGRLAADRWGRLVCFAGLGPGEVCVAGRKIVGVSQRRSRGRAQIQTMALLRAAPPAAPTAHNDAAEPDQAAPGGPGREVEFLALTPAERRAGQREASSRAGAIPADAAAVTEALLDALEAIH